MLTLVRHKKGYFSLFGKVFGTLIAGTFIIIGGYHFLKPVYINVMGQSVMGHVIKIHANQVGKPKNNYISHPVVSFETQDHKEVQFISSFLISNYSSKLIGTPVKVFYMADNSERAELSVLTGRGIFSSGIYMFMFAVGCVIELALFYSIHSGKKS